MPFMQAPLSAFNLGEAVSILKGTLWHWKDTIFNTEY